MKNQWTIVLGAIAVGAVLPYVFPGPFPRHVMIMVLVYAILGTAWNILGGYAGQVSLGHAVYFGIGAYTSTMAFIVWRLNPWVGMVLGAVIAASVAILMGYPTFKLRGFYFAIATIALGEMFRILFVNWEWVGGAVGLEPPIIKGDRLMSMQFHLSKVPYYYILFIMFLCVLALVRVIERSKLGYYFRAVKDSHEAALSSGIDTTQVKLVAVAISAFITSMVGTVYAQYLLYIDPYVVFAGSISVKVCLVAILGGEGRLMGPFFGSVVLVLLSEYSRVLFGGTGRGIDLIIYGWLIVFVAAFQPRGILGLLGLKKQYAPEVMRKHA
ncbi:MAG: branched-chain amino acid ABC transporter permease [Firmicutes bacterium]|jgi:branched-chain amino acid transport system permease protein|nr:branched-chain amino acid ABC transporter permease [Bacillota bacterium]